GAQRLHLPDDGRRDGGPPRGLRSRRAAGPDRRARMTRYFRRGGGESTRGNGETAPQEGRMNSRGLALWIDRQTWLDSVGDGVQPAVKRTFDALGPARRRVKSFLHGTWLGHPLHPALTDVPLGAWTATVLLDASESRSPRPGVGQAADMTL